MPRNGLGEACRQFRVQGLRGVTVGGTGFISYTEPRTLANIIILSRFLGIIMAKD